LEGRSQFHNLLGRRTLPPNEFLGKARAGALENSGMIEPLGNSWMDYVNLVSGVIGAAGVLFLVLRWALRMLVKSVAHEVVEEVMGEKNLPTTRRKHPPPAPKRRAR
jgi:hypothetical protein